MNRDLDLGELRRDFDHSHLTKKQLPAEPINLFKSWFADAEKTEKDPTAMVLSTSVNHRPNSRVVLLKKIKENSLTFYTNYESRKGRELEANALAALNFYWPNTDRQVRIRGKVERLAPEESDAYFASRPKESQIGATLSQQSREMESRVDFEKAIAQMAEEFKDKSIPRPDHWGGYAFVPDEFEFWQGRISRLHDRFQYSFQNGIWKIIRLNP